MWHQHYVPLWSSEFNEWATENAQKGDIEKLTQLATQVPSVGCTHPTVEHFTPLFVALGAGLGNTRELNRGLTEITVDGFQFGLAKTSF